MNIVVFGAGGRAGRQAVAEAHRRGHQVMMSEVHDLVVSRGLVLLELAASSSA